MSNHSLSADWRKLNDKLFRETVKTIKFVELWTKASLHKLTSYELTGQTVRCIYKE